MKKNRSWSKNQKKYFKAIKQKNQGPGILEKILNRFKNLEQKNDVELQINHTITKENWEG